MTASRLIVIRSSTFTGVCKRMLNSIRSRIATRYQRYEIFFAIGLMFLLGLLAYFPFASQLGFYRDDWYVLWTGRTLGPNSIIDLFTFDRPLVGYVYSFVYRLLGENALLWQIYSLSVRTVGALSFLWLLRRLWPRHKIETMTAATIMFIYPGFLQWANAMTKSNQLTTYTVGLVSLSLTVAALQSRKRGWKIVFSLMALFSAVAYWFLYEYMIGMEGLRLLIIALLIWRREIQTQLTRLREVFSTWAPYLVLIVLNLLWRLVFFESGRPGMSIDSALAPYQSRLLGTAAKRVLGLGIDFFETLISAWVVPINSITFGLEARDLLTAIGISMVSMGVFAAYYLTFSIPQGAVSIPGDQKQGALELIVIGSAAILFTLFPVIAVGRDVRWTSGFDKYTLQASAGVAMLIVGMIAFLIRNQYRWIPFTLLIGIATATHTGNAIQWQTFWEDQKDLWWQLSWRAPQIKAETVLLVEMPEKDFFEGYEIWGPANRVYNPDNYSIQISAEVFSAQTLEKIRVGRSEARSVRSILDLRRDFMKSLIVSRPERSSCWHVMEGDDPIFPESTSPLLYATVRRSKSEQIDTNAPPTIPPEHIFGSEPEHGWCYYFQKASLAAQKGNWQEVANLADQTLAADTKALDRSEWLPFLRGYVMVGRNDEAREISLWIRDNGVIRHRQCDYLSETSLPDPDRQEYLHELLCQ